MAIKRGVCHLAGSHLLDIEDGTYNISYIKKYLPDVRVQLVNLVLRDQGLGVDVMATPAACRTFNILVMEQRAFAAALIAVE